VSALWDPFLEYGFLQHALAECVLMGAVCGVLGTLVVLRGLTYTGESLAHTLIPGAAIALWLEASVLGGALAGGVLAACLIALLAARPDIGEDTAVGVVFSGAFAAGVILLSVKGSPRDLESLLFGNVLAVAPGDLWLGVAVAAGVLGLCLPLARRFVLVAFDRDFAGAAGLKARLLDAVLLVALAAALTVALRGVGALLSLALLVAPAATARVLVGRVWTMLWLAPALGVLSGIAGLELSYHAGLAAGPSICLVSLGGFLSAVLFASARAARSRVPAYSSHST
jgi:ABC-type Mn2+/Zn2+ transport system permease subunit